MEDAGFASFFRSGVRRQAKGAIYEEKEHQKKGKGTNSNSNSNLPCVRPMRGQLLMALIKREPQQGWQSAVAVAARLHDAM